MKSEKGEIQFNKLILAKNASLNCSGLYSFQITLPHEENRQLRLKHINAVIEFFRKEIIIEGKYFLEKFEGILRSKIETGSRLEAIDFHDDEYYNLLRDAIDHFAPAVYIGQAKSQTLSERLSQHFHSFKKAENEKSLIDFSNAMKDGNEYPEDREFSKVAKRLVYSNIKSNFIKIKYLAISDLTNPQIITDVEYILNRTYFPIQSKN
jgi:hypothetical protein